MNDSKGHITLWTRVLIQAMMDYSEFRTKGYIKWTYKSTAKEEVRKARSEKEFNDVVEWFNSKDTGARSFIWVCDHLDVEADQIRAYFFKNWHKLGSVIEKNFSNGLLSAASKRRNNERLTIQEGV